MMDPTVRELPNSHRLPVPGWISTIPAGSHEHARIHIYVRRSGGAPLPRAEEIGALPPRQRQHLTHEEFDARHGADPEDIKRVSQWAMEHGLNVMETHIGRRLIVIDGTVAAFFAAFRVWLTHFIYPAGSFRGYLGSLYVRADIFPLVRGVVGLDNRPVARHSVARLQAQTQVGLPIKTIMEAYSLESLKILRDAFKGGIESLGVKMPMHVAEIYDFPPETDGSGECIGIIELGGGYRTEDLATYFEFLMEQPRYPSVSAVSVGGGLNLPGIVELYDCEVALDLQVAGGAAPGAKYVCYFAPLTGLGFIDAIGAAVHDRVNNPSVISCSWDLSEGFWLMVPMDIELLEEVLAEAVQLGVTVLCSAGDYGSASEYHDGQAWVDYPASSPHVLGCGGTTLYTKDGEFVDEVAWNTMINFGQATGGGVSAVFPLPPWQEAAGVPRSVNPGGAIGRGVPDIAGEANPSTGYVVVIDGGTTIVAGTSSTAPLMAALIARINQSLGFRVGYINPYLYARAPGSGAFREITEGNNGAYSAGPGWNACAGWGRPIGTKLRDLLGA
jgi:kumamolisin